MGLKKQIELENGIILNYHRIASINKVTNNSTIIEIASYTSEEKRNIEKRAFEKTQETGEVVFYDVFINTIYINKEYNEDETIKSLYEYLKTTEMFENAENA